MTTTAHHQRCPCSFCAEKRKPLWWLPRKAASLIIAKGDEAFPFEEIERRRIAAFSREARLRLEEFIRSGTRSLRGLDEITKRDLERTMNELGKLRAEFELALAASATPYATLIAEAGAQAGFSVLPSGSLSLADLRDRVSPQVVATAQRTATRMASSVAESVSRRVASAIREGIIENMTTDEVAELIRERGGEGFDASRAETIARTETARAYGEGQIEAWKASGVVKGKTWLLAPDSCPFCEAAAERFGEKAIPLDQPFFPQGSHLTVGGRTMTLDYDSTQSPPLHPNCRCSMLSELDEEA